MTCNQEPRSNFTHGWCEQHNVWLKTTDSMRNETSRIEWNKKNLKFHRTIHKVSGSQVLQYASPRLRDDDDLVRCAVGCDGGNLEFTSARLRGELYKTEPRIFLLFTSERASKQSSPPFRATSGPVYRHAGRTKLWVIVRVGFGEPTVRPRVGTFSRKL